MVFVPVSHQHGAGLRSGQELGERRGCAVTPSFAAALGPATSDEEADFAALDHAGVLALLAGTDPLRLVLAVEVAANQVVDRRTDQGEVEVAGLRWSQVQALFADEPAAAEAVGRARSAVGPVAGSVGLAEALAAPAVSELQEAYDLLWFGVEELDQLG